MAVVKLSALTLLCPASRGRVSEAAHQNGFVLLSKRGLKTKRLHRSMLAC